MPSEQEKFLEAAKEVSIVDQPLADAPEIKEEEAKAEVPQDEEETPKRRRERRLMEKLEAEREANIQLTAKLAAISEAQKFRQENAEPDEVIARIYGTNTPEGMEATRLLQKALDAKEERAVERALEKFREEQAQAQQAVKKEENQLDTFIEELEDTHNVSFTKEMQKSYFSLMEKLSPKDSEGNILNYADPHAVWEVFSEKINAKKENRAKDLAARSMTQSGASSDSKLQDDAMRNILKQAGII